MQDTLALLITVSDKIILQLAVVMNISVMFLIYNVMLRCYNISTCDVSQFVSRHCFILSTRGCFSLIFGLRLQKQRDENMAVLARDVNYCNRDMSLLKNLKKRFTVPEIY